MHEAWIIDGARSPRGRGKPGGGLAHIHPQRCFAQILAGLQKKVGFDPADIEDVVAGCSVGNGDHAHDIARLAALDAGWPVSATGVTLHRYCGSGQQAVSFAAMAVMSGQQQAVIGGGVEFMSHYISLSTQGMHAGNAHLFAQYPLINQGLSADLIATIEGFSRGDCDAYAVESQRRAAIAKAEGRFEKSIIPVTNEDGSTALDHDEHARPGTTLESLAALTPSFTELGAKGPKGAERSWDEIARARYGLDGPINHVHHGGNSSGIVDGASAILIASPDYAKVHGLKPRARIVQTAVAGDDPVIMLTAPAPSARKCLEKAGMAASDIDLWEVNEAFASVVLKFLREMEVDPATVNPNGGAIALGHPIGATGPMLIMTVLDELERQNKSTALVSMCTGGGMGTATIIERI